MFKYLFAKNEDIPAGSAAVFFGFSSIIWFIIGTGLGSFNAAKLAFPDFVTLLLVICAKFTLWPLFSAGFRWHLRWPLCTSRQR